MECQSNREGLVLRWLAGQLREGDVIPPMTYSDRQMMYLVLNLWFSRLLVNKWVDHPGSSQVPAFWALHRTGKPQINKASMANDDAMTTVEMPFLRRSEKQELGRRDHWRLFTEKKAKQREGRNYKVKKGGNWENQGIIYKHEEGGSWIA